jgi:hypothetical protein
MVHKKKSIRTKPGVKRITVIRPLLIDGEDTDLWMDQRIGLFNELRKHAIPTAVVDAVKSLEWHRPARWVTPTGKKPQKGEKAILRLKPRQKKFRPTTTEEQEYREALSKFDAAFEVPGFAGNAGEVLAYCLLNELRSLGDGRNSPVRTHGKLSRSVIAAAAVTLFEDQDPEGSFLTELLRELLLVKVPSAEETRQFQAREAATQIIARAPHLGIRAIAGAVGVNPATVSRWRKEPSFVAKVEKFREILANPRIRIAT